LGNDHIHRPLESLPHDPVRGRARRPGGNVRAGSQGGVSFGRDDVILRVGQVRGVDGDPPLLPFYGTLALETHW
jgi:hypothetical protein